MILPAPRDVWHHVYLYTHLPEGGRMRTNIDLDEALVDEARRLTGINTKKALVEEALKVLIAARRRRSLLDLHGRIAFADGYDHRDLRRDDR